MAPIVSNFRLSLVFLVVFLLLAAWAWFTDFVTIQGESTVYTAECVEGAWQGQQCNGRMVPGERFRFRALPRRREVLFWTLGRDEPSGRFSECRIHDGRNWSCPPNPDARRTITTAVVRGHATHDAAGATRPFHAIYKWRWLLLKVGVSMRRQADY
jgi:hypothetical protein